jgi:hypothetical protein
MTLKTVTLKWDLSHQIEPDQKATLTITPTSEMIDTADHSLVGPVSHSVVFAGGTGQLTGIAANDDPRIMPAGAGYTIQVIADNGRVIVPPFTAPILHANGTTQSLSSLAQTAEPSVRLGPLAGGTSVFPSGDTTGATDQANITAAEATGDNVYFAPGTYYVTGLVKQAGNPWEGAGVGATIITLADGANADVIQGANFGTLTGSGANGLTGAGPVKVQINNMTIDGNRAYQTLTALTNAACNPATPPAAGYGIRLFGRDWTLTNVDVRNCFAYGIWTEWGSAPPSTVSADGSIEGRAVNVKVYENGVHGWYHRGPSDCQLVDVLCYLNNQAGLNAGLDFWAEGDNITNGSGTGNFSPNGLQLVNCHFWGSAAKWNLVLDCNASAANSHAEGGTTGACLQRGSVKWTGGSEYIVASQTQATGCGVQFGDTGSTAGVPTSASATVNPAHFGVITGVLADVAARAGIVWANANQGLVKALVLTRLVPTASVAAGSDGRTLPQSTIFYSGGASLPSSGTVVIQTTGGPDTVTYAGNTGSTLTGCSGGSHTMATGQGISLANVGTVATTGTIDSASDVSIELNGSGLGSGVSQLSSIHHAHGKHRLDVGAQNQGLFVTNGGTDIFNLNTNSKRAEFPNGPELRAYSDAYSTATLRLGGGTGHIGTAVPNGKSMSITAAAGAGTSPPSPTLISLSADSQGEANLGTGTSPTAGSQATVAFATAYTATPVVVLSPVNAVTAALQPYVSSANTAGFNIAFAVTPAASQSAGTYVVNYIAVARGS